MQETQDVIDDDASFFDPFEPYNPFTGVIDIDTSNQRAHCAVCKDFKVHTRIRRHY